MTSQLLSREEVLTHRHPHFRHQAFPSLDDANDAGGRPSKACTLILTEGDSAKTLAISGLSVVGRDKYGVFPSGSGMLGSGGRGADFRGVGVCDQRTVSLGVHPPPRSWMDDACG